MWTKKFSPTKKDKFTPFTLTMLYRRSAVHILLSKACCVNGWTSLHKETFFFPGLLFKFIFFYRITLCELTFVKFSFPSHRWDKLSKKNLHIKNLKVSWEHHDTIYGAYIYDGLAIYDVEHKEVLYIIWFWNLLDNKKYKLNKGLIFSSLEITS